MVWGAFVNNQTLPFVVMPPGHQTAIDFVQIIYVPVLGPYLDVHLDANGLTLMEDEASVYCTKSSKNLEGRAGLAEKQE
jgi:hypothetical protein